MNEDRNRAFDESLDRLAGETSSPFPRARIATFLLAVSGILLITHVTRLVARYALAYRRPADIIVSADAIRYRTRTEMLGRTLAERETVLARGAISRATREVRFANTPFYAGLIALCLGSYLGICAFVDGVRAASPSLLVWGLLFVAGGALLDYLLGTVLQSTRGRCRVLFVAQDGSKICLGNVNANHADRLLSELLPPTFDRQ